MLLLLSVKPIGEKEFTQLAPPSCSSFLSPAGFGDLSKPWSIKGSLRLNRCTNEKKNNVR